MTSLKTLLRIPAREWLLGAAAMAAALAVNYATGTYVDRVAPGLPPAKDLLFELLPFFDAPVVHIWGFVGFLAVLGLGVLRHEPERVPFYLWAYALIVALRGVFTTLTPVGLPPEAPTFEHYPLRGIAGLLDFRHTLFFSGHTSFPFLGFLLAGVLWVRAACLGFSLLLASSVLLSRLHYSIDVGAAFFFAYGVARFAEWSWERLRARPAVLRPAPAFARPRATPMMDPALRN